MIWYGIGGGLLSGILLILVIIVWLKRIRFNKHLEKNCACPLCSTPFDDAIFSNLGRITWQDHQKLDAFQQRFAFWKIRCEECNGYAIFTRDGEAIRSWYEE